MKIASFLSLGCAVLVNLCALYDVSDTKLSLLTDLMVLPVDARVIEDPGKIGEMLDDLICPPVLGLGRVVAIGVVSCPHSRRRLDPHGAVTGVDETHRFGPNC